MYESRFETNLVKYPQLIHNMNQEEPKMINIIILYKICPEVRTRLIIH